MNNCIDLALEILENVDFENPVRLQLIGNFKNPQSLINMDPEVFLDRFGLALKGIRKPGETVLSRFKKLVK